MGTLLERIARHEVLTPEACGQMIDILDRQQEKQRLTRDLEEFDEADYPPDVPPPIILGSKAGAVEGIRNDVGFFRTRRGRYVLSVYTKDCKDQRFHPMNEADVLIGRVSRLIYDAWGRA